MFRPARDVSWKQLARDLIREIDHDYIADFAGAISYSAFLAVFPFLLFAVALASLVIDPATLDTLVEQIRRVAPSQVAEILADRLNALTTGTKPGLLTVSAVGAIWAASGAMTALITALNSANDVHESRPFWKTRGIALLMTMAGAVLFIAASAIAIATPPIARAIGGPIGTVILWMRWPVAALIMLFVIASMYHFLPDVERRFRLVTPGSVVAVVLWVLASVGFSLYVGHFGRYEVVYGALGSVIVLMLWLWISAFVILLGAEINALLEEYVQPSLRSNMRATPERGDVVRASQRRGAAAVNQDQSPNGPATKRS
ncbi:Inner membrane protein YihY, formerly thought to be RNase BN [Minicystis rosea]|nr:Inner membrane protein YihY, formerly thought to be RNase BN [Minicystis rosea]